MKPVIAVPYFPGSNGDLDAIRAIEDFGMIPETLYFHMGDEQRLERNAREMQQMDGAFLCGGFPYEDRLGFGRVPAKIPQYADAVRTMVDAGKPVMAVCSGAQIAQVMRLAFPLDSSYRARLLPNICDHNGEIVYSGFYDDVVYTRLVSRPERTAFTRSYTEGKVMPQVIDHGGGRFWADRETLQYLIAHDLIVKQYCDEDGNVIDDFPVNPNGSMMNIEAITNERGNVKIGMAHDERKTGAFTADEATRSFASMREYIEDGCPDLRSYARLQIMPIRLKNYNYLCPVMDPARTFDIYIKMLTDDNERNVAQLFLEKGDIDRRRLLRTELREGYADMETAKRVLTEIAGMDLLAGIMLKKDLPTVSGPLADSSRPVITYEISGQQDGRRIRSFISHSQIVEGFPVTHEDVSSPNPGAYTLKKRLWENPFLLDVVTNLQTGSVFFFPDEASKQVALQKLLD